MPMESPNVEVAVYCRLAAFALDHFSLGAVVIECYLVVDATDGWSVMMVDQRGNRNTIVSERASLKDALLSASATLGKPVYIRLLPEPTIASQ